MTATRVPLSAEAGRSLCRRCRHYDWGVFIGAREWEHVCLSPLEGFHPDDGVVECPGFDPENPGEKTGPPGLP